MEYLGRRDQDLSYHSETIINYFYKLYLKMVIQHMIRQVLFVEQDHEYPNNLQ